MERKSIIKKILTEGLNIPKKEPDLFTLMMDYESGELDDKGTIKLFAKLVQSGQAWQLQGAYGRMANHLIQNGFIDKNGNILVKLD